jgi:hypothetical protein
MQAPKDVYKLSYGMLRGYVIDVRPRTPYEQLGSTDEISFKCSVSAQAGALLKFYAHCGTDEKDVHLIGCLVIH